MQKNSNILREKMAYQDLWLRGVHFPYIFLCNMHENIFKSPILYNLISSISQPQPHKTKKSV